MRHAPIPPILTSIVVAAFAAATLYAQQPGSASARTAAAQIPPAPAAVFSRYCVTCHNERLKTAGLVIDPADLNNAAAAMEAQDKREAWEKVARKLRSSTMPPDGMPRPDRATYEAITALVEGELDRTAAAKPNPGAMPLLHRLTRTEYENAVRDLVAIDRLPKEMDYSVLLPSDNVSSGFDNISDLLFVSPTAMERYVDAARKISRLAIGDASMPPMVNIHRLHPEQWQDARVEDLSIGTRGGLAVHSYFPLDADYVIKVDVAGAPRDTHQIEITIDGERVQLKTIGGGARTARGGGRGAPADPPLQFRIPV